MILYDFAAIAISFGILALAAKVSIGRLINVSRHFGFSEFTISFLFIGVVTILPELSVGINSALQGASNFGLGIVFGSNIADLTLVIGLVAIAANGIRLTKHTSARSRLFIFSAMLPVLLLLDGTLSRLDGVILLAGFVVYMAAILSGEKRRAPVRAVESSKNMSVLREGITLVAALGIMFIAGDLIAASAIAISADLAVPIFFLGTMAAIGTCLPELTFALQASRSRHPEMGFGDILGNVFADCMATIGVIAVISPITPSNLPLALFSGALMVFSMLAIVLIFTRKASITKNEGIALVIIYVLLLLVQFAAEEISASGLIAWM